jgi:transposase
MVRERKHQELGAWMEDAIRSGIPELLSFVVGIERDDEAVHAALPWREARHGGQSQQTEARSNE